MIAVAALAAALPVAAVLLLLRLPARDEAAPLSRAVAVSLAIGIGLGLSSYLFLCSLLIFDGTTAAVVVLDAGGLLIAAVVWWRRRIFPTPSLARRSSSPARSQPKKAAWLRQRVPPPWTATDRVLAVAVGLAAIAAAAAFTANVLILPHGEWDAWAIWNLRARALFRARPDWSLALGHHVLHADYPLLLPGVIARLWIYCGEAVTWIPAAVAASYAAALTLLLFGAVAELRGRTAGFIASLCLLGTPVFLRDAPRQYADTPLAFYCLAALALIAVWDRYPERGLSPLVWAGVAAGFAAWTKNEGILFVLCLVVANSALRLAKGTPLAAPRPLLLFALGLLPAAVALAYFKTVWAPTNDLVKQPLTDMIPRAIEPLRYAVILRELGSDSLRSIGLLLVGMVVYATLLGLTADRSTRRVGRYPLLTVALVAVGYGTVYVLMTRNIARYMQLSIDRLVLQLWPSVLFVLFLFLASPSERGAAATETGSPPKRPHSTAATIRQRR